LLFCEENFDIAVIGAGHAGIEASLAAARIGCKVVVFTINVDFIGNCPCNPSIGGTAKGHLVREIDALGGEMAKTTDACSLQSRLLNASKGPAVHSLRAQIDRRHYGEIMKKKLEIQKNLYIKQTEIVDILRDPKENCFFLKTRTDVKYKVKSVILSTGTYMGGKIFIGKTSFNSGPDGIFPAMFLKKSLEKFGVEFKRFKTGTPARILKSSVNFEKMIPQFGDKKALAFSFETNSSEIKNHSLCFITWTNEKTKDVVLKNLSKSVLYSRETKGIGPRYCPSIEEKFLRFKDKERHQVFVEPCGLNTDEMYLQGLSSSLPEDVQVLLYSTISGLENAHIVRCAYAIEYDVVDPLQLTKSLEFKNVPMLFCAGQVAGSSGYEEAAAQGILVGINSARKILKKPCITLNRQNSYIGTLVDDMTTKGVTDPYRIMTSRSEYRLLLRHSNADERLTPIGREVGLISDERWKRFQKKLRLKELEMKRVKSTFIFPSKRNDETLKSFAISKIESKIKIIDLLKRPEINYKVLKALKVSDVNISKDILDQVEIEIKYEGYINRQINNIKKTQRYLCRKIPNDINYKKIKGLRLEAVEKLSQMRPTNIAKASEISGVNPADISVLIIWLMKLSKKAL
jgi:tRNA uridine 5-carboxymethylaminomethyl modification enzyme